jgi:hypothetical protein
MNSIMGPCNINCGEAFKLDQFSPDLIKSEITRYKNLLKSRNHTDAVEALIALEILGK